MSTLLLMEQVEDFALSEYVETFDGKASLRHAEMTFIYEGVRYTFSIGGPVRLVSSEPIAGKRSIGHPELNL